MLLILILVVVFGFCLLGSLLDWGTDDGFEGYALFFGIVLGCVLFAFLVCQVDSGCLMRDYTSLNMRADLMMNQQRVPSFYGYASLQKEIIDFNSKLADRKVANHNAFINWFIPNYVDALAPIKF